MQNFPMHHTPRFPLSSRSRFGSGQPSSPDMEDNRLTGALICHSSPTEGTGDCQLLLGRFSPPYLVTANFQHRDDAQLAERTSKSKLVEMEVLGPEISAEARGFLSTRLLPLKPDRLI